MPADPANRNQKPPHPAANGQIRTGRTVFWLVALGLALAVILGSELVRVTCAVALVLVAAAGVVVPRIPENRLERVGTAGWAVSFLSVLLFAGISLILGGSVFGGGIKEGRWFLEEKGKLFEVSSAQYALAAATAAGMFLGLSVGVALVALADSRKRRLERDRRELPLFPADSPSEGTEGTEDIEASIVRHREAIERNPGNATAHIKLAESCLVRGRTEEALTEFTAAIEILAKLNMPDLCVQVCGRVLQIDPDNKTVQEIMTKQEIKRDAFKALESARGRDS